MPKLSKLCSYPGCMNKSHAKGLCNKHYKRSRMIPKQYEKVEKKIIKKPYKPKEIWFKHEDQKYQNLVNGWFNLVFRG